MTLPANSRCRGVIAVSELQVARTQRRPRQDFVARRSWHLALRQAPGAGPVPAAGEFGRRGVDRRGAARLPAGGDRLAEPGSGLAAEKAAAGATRGDGFTRRKPARKPLPAHLPRGRVTMPGPTSCACCGSDRLSKIGEDITETPGAIPRRWKAIRTVRENSACRDCEKIGQPPAPFHATPRGWEDAQRRDLAA